MSDRTLSRVLFEYSDGTAEEITGPLAHEWYRRLLSDSVYLAVHGMEWPQHLSEAWKPVPAPPAERTCGTCDSGLPSPFEPARCKMGMDHRVKHCAYWTPREGGR